MKISCCILLKIYLYKDFFLNNQWLYKKNIIFQFNHIESSWHNKSPESITAVYTMMILLHKKINHDQRWTFNQHNIRLYKISFAIRNKSDNEAFDGQP